jgi:nicotinamidase-related amidase
LKRDAEGRTDLCLGEKRHIVKKLIICEEKPMPELSHIDPRSAALLAMDYQVDTLTRFMTAAQSADVIARGPELIAAARDAGMMVIHVVVAFRPGHPEISPRNLGFSPLKANGMKVAGSEGAAIHPAAAAREGEPIVVKHRVSPFVGTDLETLLRANGVDTVVLAGVHTSGVVPSGMLSSMPSRRKRVNDNRSRT